MIAYKTDEEIKLMIEGGAKLRRVFEKLFSWVKAGMTTRQIDDEATRLIKSQGADLSFNKVRGYSWATCLCVNEQVVHTPPKDRVLRNGDVLTIDAGVYFKGFHTDSAITFAIGKCDAETEKFLSVGRFTLEKAISKAKAGARLGEISKTIEEEISKAGYYVIRELTGHGVGRQLHEDPFVPGFLEKSIDKTLLIKPGLVIAIEIIYSKGTAKIVNEKGSDWSIRTKDGSLSACFEHTIAITKEKTIILT